MGNRVILDERPNRAERPNPDARPNPGARPNPDEAGGVEVTSISLDFSRRCQVQPLDSPPPGSYLYFIPLLSWQRQYA